MVKKNNKYTVGVGLLSIVVTFVILALTVLGSLSVLSARADYRLSQKNGDYIKAYYRATKEAEELLAEIDSKPLADFPAISSYYVPIVENQKLEVIISKEDEGYKILSWRVIHTKEWQEEQSGFNDIIIKD